MTIKKLKTVFFLTDPFYKRSHREISKECVTLYTRLDFPQRPKGDPAPRGTQTRIHSSGPKDKTSLSDSHSQTVLFAKKDRGYRSVYRNPFTEKSRNRVKI